MIPTHVMQAIESELEHQRRKHSDHQHSVAEWLMIIEVLTAKAKDSWYHTSDAAATEILRKIAATAISALSQSGLVRPRALLDGYETIIDELPQMSQEALSPRMASILQDSAQAAADITGQVVRSNWPTQSPYKPVTRLTPPLPQQSGGPPAVDE